jgi:cell division protein FtsB
MNFRLPRFDYLVSFGCLALLGYFAWHALEGPRGYAYRDLQVASLSKLDAELMVEVERKRLLEAKVSLMRPESIDPDMLEELARTQLEMSRRNELVIRLDGQKTETN